jgi:hypothetical protein
MGMPVFSELSDEQLEGLRHYIRKRAHENVVEDDKAIKGMR